MRLMTTALLAVFAVPALAIAQTAPAPSGTGARPGNEIGTGQSLPLSNRAANNSPADAGSVIAPRLPEPNVPPDSGPEQYLMAARQALAAHQTGVAQEALERAETRALDRSVAPSRASDPNGQRLIKQINDARNALSTGDAATAMQIIDSALRPI
jgi:hypothetical protein